MDLHNDLIRLFGTRHRIGVGRTSTGVAHDLWPEERRAMARATAKRRAEFAAGRAAARAALRGIGLVPFAIPMAADRAPVWPRGVVGSITHHDGDCLAIVARNQRLAGLGLDLEARADLPGDLWDEVLTAPEMAWLTSQIKPDRGLLARIIFSAKEAAYKALYPVTGKVVGFDAMVIHPDPDTGRFSARLATGFGAYGLGTILHGYIFQDRGYVLTALALPLPTECGQIAAVIPDMEMECFRAQAV
jgi:4'-phosphopantetheinyl transferase EntD